MILRAALAALAATTIALASAAAHAQALAKPPSAMTESELKEVLVWNSPWEGRATAPGKLYSYRTTFKSRQNLLLAEVISYSTNQRSDSVVTMQNGRLTWQDSNGADVSVALADAGDLVGIATTGGANVPIVLSPRK